MSRRCDREEVGEGPPGPGRILSRGRRPRDFPGFDFGHGDPLAARAHWYTYCWHTRWWGLDHAEVLAHLRERPLLPPFSARTVRLGFPPGPLPEWLARAAGFLARIDGVDVRHNETAWTNYEIG